MQKIFRNDVKERKEFDRAGYHYTQILGDDEKHIYLYKMEPLDWKSPHKHYELVVGKKYKNPDGNYVYVYPCDEDFGTFGWYICGTPENTRKKIADKWLSFTNYPPVFDA